MSKTKTTRYDVAEHLRTSEEMAAYLEACFEESKGDASFVAKALGDDFDIEITESHHNQKADAPSGTALGIARSICAATNRDIDKDLVNGRSGKPGPRTKKEIGMHALRLGSVVGHYDGALAGLVAYRGSGVPGGPAPHSPYSN